MSVAFPRPFQPARLARTGDGGRAAAVGVKMCRAVLGWAWLGAVSLPSYYFARPGLVWLGALGSGGCVEAGEGRGGCLR